MLTEVLAEPLVAVIQADHRLAGQAELEIEQLLGEDFVLFPYKYMNGFYTLVHSLFEGFSRHASSNAPSIRKPSWARGLRARGVDPSGLGVAFPDAGGGVPADRRQSAQRPLCGGELG